MRSSPDWDDRCDLLLTDAFVRGYLRGPVDDFRETLNDDAGSGTGMTARHRYLKDLMTSAELLQEDPLSKRPYWRQRQDARDGAAVTALSFEMLVSEFVTLIRELDQTGYLDKRFGMDCIDDARDDPAAHIEREIGTADLWPLHKETLAADSGVFYDVVEVLHDLMARPRKPGSYHSFGDCGWHREEFDIDTGRIVYRWRVNKLFARTDCGLRLAEEGEDIGRLVTVTDSARADLVQAVASRRDGEASDQVRHALALFRDRGADRNQKRSAVAVLALVVEERRHAVLTDAMAKSDSGALFEIANKFNIRHQRADQRRDYEDFYLDWIFWVYLASIELTNRVIDSQKRAQS